MKASTGKKGDKTAAKEVVIEVTQQEYDEQKAKGFDEDELLKPGKHKFRRVTPDRMATKEDLKPSNIKVQITMKIDLDVYNQFKVRSESTHAAPYQTQINAELRKIMEHDLAQKQVETQSEAEKLLENKEFVKKLYKKFKEFEAQPA